MRWITGLFDWIYRVQSYEANDWSYMRALEKFVDNGFVDDDYERYPFFDTVSSVFVRDCHANKCSNLQITKQDARRSNFDKIMEIMKVTDRPTRKPTQKPIVYSEPSPAPFKPKIEIKPPPLAWSPPQSQSRSVPTYAPSTTEVPPAANNPSPTTDFIPIVVDLTPPAPPTPPLISITPPTTDEVPQQTDAPFGVGGLIILEDNAACSVTGVTWLLSVAIVYNALY